MNVSVSPAYVERLEAHSAMLGRIGSLVAPWVTDPVMTTEDAVKLLLADYWDCCALRSERLREEVYEAKVCNGGGVYD